ncbi:aminotransferase class I/II-fold pyridoxal phosphate-dependent enzyme [Microbacterium sediminis]|uniref:aminotransferase class I/II-fold pyridoxal phosphate-dependent enzyme n=1 Tax=Microbacterium sediminis TaxID=904291 RepID=UPI001071CF02|nr:aminotransferase class I/II-fold pyridoxal phosphate-dependent enzyme [Microbacterium sediminis]QBR74391.1 aminotransferase class I/II-fold pyridoxal phosphate-dependent enzyme [Microbacterium sediminis]
MTDADILRISGATAAEIADSIRALVERGALAPGDALPPVRTLAATLGVNRNTAVAAYRQLAAAGLVTSQGRAGTRIAGTPATPQEGFAPSTELVDVGSANPDPALLPRLEPALRALEPRPVLYGEAVIDAGLERWAREWLAPDTPRDPRLTITNGSFDAVERLLAQALTRDDAVALEDPCYLATIRTARLAGYRPLGVPVDAEGMTVEGLRAALAEGARAVVCTPRAQNPTGAGLTEARATALREVLADHPYVLVIEDDHYSLLSRHPYRSMIAPDHRRWALVRSVSKFLGPDMSLAVVASDPHTADRLAQRLSPGTTWVSHLLQRLAHALLSDPDTRASIDRAGAHYAARNAAFADRLGSRGLAVAPGDGLSLWIPVHDPAREVAARLRTRGWLVRPGDEFSIDAAAPSHHLRVTAHHLDDAAQERLAADVAASARGA